MFPRSSRGQEILSLETISKIEACLGILILPTSVMKSITPIKRNLYYLLSNSMEDFILREIDRLGEMLLIIARKLGLQEDVMPDYSLLDVKDEFDKAVCPISLDALLEQENPVWYLVETEKISDHGLETFIEILFHSDLDEDRKAAILHYALAYLDGKGLFSFKLHALSNS